MPPNPLNSSVCVGCGLTVDSLGRPQWKAALLNSVAISSATAAGLIPPASNTVLLTRSGFIGIANTSLCPRLALVQYRPGDVTYTQDPAGVPNSAPYAEALFLFSIGAGVTTGATLVYDDGMDIPAGGRFKNRIALPPLTYPAIVPASTTWNAACTIQLQAFGRPPGFIDYTYSGGFITVWWIGGG